MQLLVMECWSILFSLCCLVQQGKLGPIFRENWSRNITRKRAPKQHGRLFMYRTASNKHLSGMMSAYSIHSGDANCPVSHSLRTFGPVTFPQTFLAPRAGAQFRFTSSNRLQHAAQPQQSVAAAEPSWEALESAGLWLRSRPYLPRREGLELELPTRHLQDAPLHRPPSPARPERPRPSHPGPHLASWHVTTTPVGPCTAHNACASRLPACPQARTLPGFVVLSSISDLCQERGRGLHFPWACGAGHAPCGQRDEVGGRGAAQVPVCAGCGLHWAGGRPRPGPAGRWTRPRPSCRKRRSSSWWGARGWPRRRGRVGTSVYGGLRGGRDGAGAVGKGSRASGLGRAGPGRRALGWRAGEGGERGPGRGRPACGAGSEQGPQIRAQVALGGGGGGCRCPLGEGEVKLEWGRTWQRGPQAPAGFAHVILGFFS